jgi:hypothetical protein
LALLGVVKADASQGFKPLTVPFVNVWATAHSGVLSSTKARALCVEAEAQFYQSRTWRSLFDALGWDAALRERVLAKAVDLKAQDARAALKAVAKLRRPSTPPGMNGAVPTRLSSFVRRTRISTHGLGPSEDGVKTLLLADFARQAALVPEPKAVARRLAQLSGPYAADQLATWAEALALEELVLSSPEHFVADGPSHLEGAALQAALRKGR